MINAVPENAIVAAVLTVNATIVNFAVAATVTAVAAPAITVESNDSFPVEVRFNAVAVASVTLNAPAVTAASLPTSIPPISRFNVRAPATAVITVSPTPVAPVKS